MAFDETTDLLYVVGAEDSNLRRYDVKTGAVVELVSPNSQGVSYPRDVAIGPDNRLYVARLRQ